MNILKLIEDFDTVVDETCNNLKDKILADFKIPNNQIEFKLSDDLQFKKIY